MTDVIQTIEGKNCSARVVNARGLDGKLGYFEVQYEYSRKNNMWKYHTERNTGFMKSFTTKALAIAAAKRIIY
jgi:hypothetical protein